MTATGPFRSIPLEGGLKLDFFDLGNRYFGDYHRIKILVRCEVPLRETMFAAESDPRRAFDRARRRLGERVVYERSLERMGVAGADVEAVRDRMIDAFLSSAGPYLRHPEFPRRLVESRLRSHRVHPLTIAGR
ncbi:hypothetical protein B5V00_00865 [Geothermobacter hydrogeniphilus]|uniref:Uncharacterized protein n=2 Tax=Geothermobacter hydrogeniphilus TaxID=1969733 RepID=A0A1X0YE79_9BACT|nr:hypothetical protein B5V00_00865 [Geothermobacter hydrogeniphilus]